MDLAYHLLFLLLTKYAFYYFFEFIEQILMGKINHFLINRVQYLIIELREKQSQLRRKQNWSLEY